MSIPHLNPALVKLPALNFWALVLLATWLLSLIIVAVWLKPSADTVKRLLYQSITSEPAVGCGYRETDYKKCMGWAAFTLVAFLLIKKQLMAVTAAVGSGASDSNIDSLLLFCTGMATTSIFATKFKADAQARAVVASKAAGTATSEATPADSQ